MAHQVLEQVSLELKALNIISSNREFCTAWLAKDPSYMRVLRFHNRTPSADALVTCASKLGYYAEHLAKSPNSENHSMAAKFTELRGLCLSELDQLARSKWMTAERMGLCG
ncbi:hypothetical protein RAZWK3B_11727 [Roseobacter sp. AzwK-3b]|uniref:DUF6626 family protein n=1 Tax=Roseobacter sp. AzwK-3b TaxID=351016 RepID=UPI000156A1C5|nr:DUF6626 family protein [Roseobacter sp. AzwK-3b]EDM69406.1 hypothetical protein RAZWK3B_11727 [Roseobacter sp. AzwK-3b]